MTQPKKPIRLSRRALLITTVLMATLLCATGLLAQAPSSLHVQLTGVEPDRGGRLLIALFGAEEGWGEPARAIRTAVIEVTEDMTLPHSVRFSGLPPGDGYAVQVLHDANGNGKLDMRWLPVPRPKEGVGVSHNRERMGPPRYTDARIAVPAPGPVVITVRYD